MAELSIPYTLETPFADIDLNADLDDYAKLIVQGITGLDMGEVRITIDDAPQRDGSIIHKPRRKGLSPTFSGLVHTPGGNVSRQELSDQLRGALLSIIGTDGRLTWTPPGQADRILDRVRLNQAVLIDNWQEISPVLKTFQFGLVSRFPYSIDATEIETVIADGDTETITNGGNADMFPVFRVYSLGTDLTITNETTIGGDPATITLAFTGLGLDGGSYLEIDTFKETAFENGNEADWGGALVFETSDFIWLPPGDSEISVDGGDAHMLWQNAWAGA